MNNPNDVDIDESVDAISGTRMAYQRRDVNGSMADCAQEESATGTWSIEGDALDVVLEEGETERRAVNLRECGIGEDLSYAQRPMTEDELKHRDFVDGPFSLEGDELVLTTFFSNGTENPRTWIRITDR